MLIIAKKNDIAVVLAHALDKNNCFPEDVELKNALQKEVMMAVYRYKRLNYEFQNICGVFNRNNIYPQRIK